MEKLYNQLNKTGQYTKSLDEFKEQFGTPEKSQKLYTALNEAGDYTKSFEDFQSQFGFAEAGKINDSANVDLNVESQKENTGSKSENGLSESKKQLTASDESMGLKGSTFVSDISSFLKDVYKGATSKEEDKAPKEAGSAYSITRALKEKPTKTSLNIITGAAEGFVGAFQTLNKILIDDLILDSYETEGILLMEGATAMSEGRSTTSQEKTAIAGAAKNLGIGTNLSLPSMRLGTKKIDEKLQSYQTEFDNTITEEIAKGSEADWSEVAGRIVSGSIKSAPYSALSANKYTAAALALSIANDKFVEEYSENPDKALWQVVGNAATTGGIEMADAWLSRKLLRSKGLLKGDKLAGDAIKNLNKGISRKILDVAGIGAKEGATEIAQSISTKINDQLWLGDKETLGEDIGKDIFKNSYEIIDEGIIGAFSGGGMASIQTALGSNEKLADRAKVILMDPSIRLKLNNKVKEITALKKDLDQAKADNNPKKESAIRRIIEKTAADHVKLKRGSDYVLDLLQDNDLKTYADNIDNINSLSKGESSSVIKEKINTLKQENAKILQDNLKEIVKKDLTFEEALLEVSQESFDANFKKKTEAAIKLSTDLDFEYGPRVFKTTEEYTEAIIKDAYEKEDIKNENEANNLREKIEFSDGAYLGADRMFIDKQRASEVNSFNVSNHEILHPVLNAIVGNKDSQAKVVQEFKKRMTKKQIAVVQKKLDASVDPSNHNTEFLTYFSDAIQAKEISYDKNIFYGIAEYIKNLFKKNGFENIDFQDGKQVYDFLKVYNQSILKKGEVSKDVVEAIKKGEKSSGVKSSEAKAEESVQESKTLAEDVKVSLVNDITEIKRLAKENVEVAAKFGKEPIKGRKQTRLEEKVLTGLEPVVEKVVTNRTKALYDKIADDAKRNVTRQEFQDSMRSDIQTMVLNEYTAEKQDLEKFIVNRSYLRANNLAKRLGIESKEDGGIKADVTAAKDIVATETEQSIDRSGSVERGQATFDQLDIVDDELTTNIEKDLSKEIRVRTQKGTLSEMIDVKKGRETYSVTWLEDYINKQLFKKLSKKLGAIGEKNGETTIPGAYIDFLNDPKTFDIITKALPIKSLKKSYGKLFPTERVGREKTAEGNPVFKIKKIKPKTFLQYFLDGKKSTILERQKQLFREILEPITKQLIESYVTPDNLKELKSIKELAPKDSVDAVNSIVLETQLKNLESAIDRYKGESSSFDIIQFSKSLRDTFGLDESQVNFGDAKQVVNSRKGLVKLFKNFKKYGLDAGQVANMFIGTARSQWGILAKDYVPGKEGELVRVKKIDKDKYRSQRFLMTGAKDFFVLLSKAYPNIEYKQYKGYFKSGNVKYDLDKIPSQGTKGFADGSMIDGSSVNNSTIKERNKYTEKQRANLKKIVNLLSKMYEDKSPTGLTANQTAMILATFASSTNGLVRTAAKLVGFSKQGLTKAEQKVSDNYRFEHAQTASSTVADLGMLIADSNYPHSFDQIMDGFNVYIIPKIYDNAINKAYRSKIPRDAKGYMVLSSEEKAARYNDKKTKAEIAKAGLKPLKINNFPVLQLSKTNADINTDFNNIIEGATGIAANKKISKVKGKVLGEKKGRFKFFIPPSADDFAGLLYKLTGKGKKGEKQQAWFKENLFDPFGKGIRDFESYKENVTAVVRELKKEIKKIPQGLKKINSTGFTNEVAVRVYLWNKNEYDINDIEQSDIQELVDVVENNKDLLEFANQMEAVLEKYPEPQENWLAGTITTDTINMINTTKRAEFLEAWQNNADEIFSKDNLNKLRAGFGDNYVEALEDMLYRMKTGRNRPSGANKLTNNFMNWVNDSVGTIMFFNTRSALLQTLSTVNFINWGDNNPVAAAKAFGNQKQFWSDFSMLFNSDFLKQRRSGLKNDVNADDIAKAAESATNKTKAVLASILKKGFLPTQMADSFAIALGGASFLRNRINSYIKEGMSKTEAEKQAFLDFQEVTEESQQSSRPDRVSQQQASPLGRIVLAFANTPMQYMRLSKKAFLDIKNKRGDLKTNLTKLAYYAAVQNIIFSSLQTALFAALFDDDEDELKDKELRVANSMLDTMLRGVGVYGAAVSTLKNITMEVVNQANKDRPDFTVAAQRALSLSPPIDSKMRKIMSAGRAFSYKTTREKMKGFGLDNPAYYAVGQVVSAATNVPLDRAIRKADNLRVAVDNDTKYWQSLALLLGYSQWDVGMVETSKSKKKKKSNFGTTTKWKKKMFKKKTWKFN